MNNQPDLGNQIEVLIEPTEDVTNVHMIEKGNANFKVKFTPKVPGAYSIRVTFNGDKIPCCPFITQVKERELVVVSELNLKLFPGSEALTPSRIAVNTTGKIAITDHDRHCVYIFNKQGNCLRKIDHQKDPSAQFLYPGGLEYLNDEEILVTDTGNDRIQQVNVETGTVVKSFGSCGGEKGEFSSPVDVCLDEQRRIVVTDCGNRRIQVMTLQGETTIMFGDSGPEKLNNPTSCIPCENMFLVADGNNDCIKSFDQSGTFLYKFGKLGNQDGQFNWPYGMLLDRSNLLVCDNNNNRIQQFSLDGRFTGKTITQIPNPIGIATAPDGRILVTSYTAQKVYILK